MDSGTVAELRGLAVSSGVARAPCKAQVPVNAGAALALHKKQPQAGVVVVFVVSCAMLHMFVSRPQHKHSVDHLPASGGEGMQSNNWFLCAHLLTLLWMVCVDSEKLSPDNQQLKHARLTHVMSVLVVVLVSIASLCHLVLPSLPCCMHRVAT